MYVCMYVCMYVMYVCMYVCTYVRMYVCTYVCLYVCTYVRMYVCTYVRMYVCTYVRMYVCTYVRMYVYTYTIWHIYCLFHNCLCFSINMYLILNIHECNFQLQILHFLKSVLHPFMPFMSAFQKRTCPDWTCTSSKDGLTTIESRPFPGIIYILP